MFLTWIRLQIVYIFIQSSNKCYNYLSVQRHWATLAQIMNHDLWIKLELMELGSHGLFCTTKTLQLWFLTLLWRMMSKSLQTLDIWTSLDDAKHGSGLNVIKFQCSLHTNLSLTDLENLWYSLWIIWISLWYFLSFFVIVFPHFLLYEISYRFWTT